MPPATDLADCTATELLQLYRSRQASPVEATRAVLARIDTLNPVLNAFCHLAPDEALASAQASEARWRDGTAAGRARRRAHLDQGPDPHAGWPTLRGSRTVDAKQPWDVDAPATARLREAGAVLLGKTTTPEFGCKGETNSPLTGITRNPWDPSKTPGGSSGGTAAAVAAGMGPLSVGTDGAGSVRIPAAFCGNFGLKPSFGRVPAYPLSPMGTVAHLGPHTMSVRDAALMMNVLKQPDARDWTSLPPDDSDYLAQAGRRHPRPEDRLFADTGLRQGHPSRGRRRGAGGGAATAGRRARIVEQVDPGIDDPLPITIGLWFAGAWAIWNTLSAEQQALADPDFASRGRARLEVQRARPAAPDAGARRAGLAHAPVHAALRPAGHAGGGGAGLRRAPARPACR